MLPPVRPVSNPASAPSVVAQGLPAELGSIAADVPSDGSTAASGSSVQIAGRLGGMLLGSRDGMADSLFMLVDALGRALDMPRRGNEPSIAYALRLAEAIRTLPPGERQDAERLLNLIVEGIRLRLVTEALKNPGGPEAARVVAYLEMARLRDRPADRDLAARVTSTYRQNDGSSQSQAASPAAGATGTPKPSPSAGLPARAPDTIVDARTDAPQPLPASARPAATKDLSIRETAPAALPASLADASEMPTPELAEMSGEGDRAEAEARTGREAPSVRTLAARADARMLQDILRQAFEGGETSDPDIQARATAEMMGSTDPEEGAEGAEPGRRKRTDNRSADTEPHLRAGRRASDERRALRQDERRESIFFLKGWKDAVLADALHGQDPADPVHAAVTALRPRADRQSAEDIRDAGFRERAAEAMAEGRIDLAAGSSLAADDEGPAKDAALPAKARLTAQSLDAAATQTADPLTDRLDVMVPAFPARDGVPYAIVNYLPSPDFLDMTDAEEAQHRGEDEADAGGDGETPAGDPESEQGAPEAAAEAEEVAADAADAFVDDDPAYGYYQRMAGII